MPLFGLSEGHVRFGAYFKQKSGWVAERSKATVLKTVVR